ncbi:MAG: DUF1599 domain-containing protein [Bacteroidia bacterium]|nr:DUF1599 domain-containing protein [Bacteroidia bacterium]
MGSSPTFGTLTLRVSSVLPPNYSFWRQQALDIFAQKRSQYGESWKELSLPSLIDMLHIKASRIRTLLTESREPATGEAILHDWLALANYSALALTKLRGISPDKALSDIYTEAQTLLIKKNLDYGDAWQDMRPLTFIEFILMKLARLKQMDMNPQQYATSIADNLFDIMNYALLYLSRYGSSFITS